MSKIAIDVRRHSAAQLPLLNVRREYLDAPKARAYRTDSRRVTDAFAISEFPTQSQLEQHAIDTDHDGGSHIDPRVADAQGLTRSDSRDRAVRSHAPRCLHEIQLKKPQNRAKLIETNIDTKLTSFGIRNRERSPRYPKIG